MSISFPLQVNLNLQYTKTSGKKVCSLTSKEGSVIDAL